MRSKTVRFFMAALVVVDAAMIALAFVLAYHLRLRTEYPPPVKILPLSDYLGMLIIQVIVLVVVFGVYKLYLVRRAASRIDELYTVFVAVSVGTLITIALTSLVLKGLDYPRLMLAYAWLLTIALVGLGRWALGSLQAALYARGVGEERMLIVGAGQVGQMILQAVRRTPKLGYQAVGFIDNDPALHEVDSAPVLGSIDTLAANIREHQIGEVIIALPHASHQEILEIISRCELEHVSIKVFPDIFQIMASEVTISDLNGLPLVSMRDVALRGWRVGVKRAIDLVFSAALLVLLSPFLLLVALLLKLGSPGPVFYSQERVGLDGQPFPCIKFRSMRVDAEANGPGWTTKDDPRRTTLGTLLRRYSIDELPQFINIFLGQMSVVGPRPERPVYVEQFRQIVPRYMGRHREKAGITGWAQINGLRGDTSIEERTRYDLWYVENWSLWLDIKIMLRTPLVLLEGRGY